MDKKQIDRGQKDRGQWLDEYVNEEINEKMNE